MNAIPKVYAPRGLGPNQQRWMERQGWTKGPRAKQSAHIHLYDYAGGRKCWCGHEKETV